MNPVLAASLEPGMILASIMAGIGGTIALVAIITGAIQSSLKTRQIEQTKRELAAYVAEGSMNAEDAYKILAGNAAKGGSCGPSCKCAGRK
ncbi:MAG: hypothetical protein NTV94_16350 [Planctomycetota bacterium]|nr:hypothetical protein [Planctomycetota bacterium]